MKSAAAPRVKSPRSKFQKEALQLMTQYVGCYAHRRYSVFATVDEEGKLGPSIRVEHETEQFRKYLLSLTPGSPVAV